VVEIEGRGGIQLEGGGERGLGYDMGGKGERWGLRGGVNK